MGTLTDSVSELRDSLSYLADDKIAELSDIEVIDFTIDLVYELELENSLYSMAMEHNITGPVFERWSEAAMKKLEEQKEGEEVSTEDLLALLKDVRT